MDEEKPNTETEEVKEKEFSPKEHFIGCPRNGSSRSAACCVFYDRYKTCRRKCKSLHKHLTAFPDLPGMAIMYFNERKKQEDSFSSSIHEELYKSAGLGLPTEKFGCQCCKFIAKSERGLKIHMKRTHGVSARNG